MLVITFKNNGTGDDQIGNYDVVVSVNGKTVEETRIEGHERTQEWRKLVGRLVYAQRQSELEQALNALFDSEGHLCVDAVDGVRMLQKLVQAQQVDISRYEKWIEDLQMGGWVNCVYCGHRYGPDDEVPTSMAQVLKEHVEECPEHPMSALKAELEDVRARNDLFSRCMRRGQKLWKEAHPDKPCMWPDGAKNISWLLDELENARRRAREEYRVFRCPKCHVEFDDPGEDKEYPLGILCPSCTGDVKGIIHPRYVRRIITQDDWDKATLDQTLDQELIEELREDIDRLTGQISEIGNIVGIDLAETEDDSEIVRAIEAKLAPQEIPAPKVRHYVYAGKLGPWARNGCQGERYLAVGLQGHATYHKILKAEKDGDSWRYIKVYTDELAPIHSCGCGTNVYKGAWLSE